MITKDQYITKVNLLETVTVFVNRGNYHEKLVPYDLKIYETIEATHMNNEITMKPLVRILKKIGYKKGYVLTDKGYRQRLIKGIE